MRAALPLGLLAGLLLAGCAGPVPDSNLTASSPDMGGAPFGSYAAYELERAQREAALTGANAGGLAAAPTTAFVAPAPVAAAPLGGAPATGISATDLAAAGIGGAAGGIAPLAADHALPAAAAPATVAGDAFPAVVPSAAPAPLATATPAAAPAAGGALGTATLTAPGTPAQSPARPEWNPAADPLRDHGLEAQPGNAQPVLVTAAATGAVQDTGPNLVEYALSAPNSRGQEWYSRFAFSGQGRMQRNCADYRTPDEAQRDFLARGGPQRDSRGLDPDGDGFACGWDPAPFRAAVGR